jgi:DNA-binding XRE family transcriptional regulator
METTPTFKTITLEQKEAFAKVLHELRERDGYSVAELADTLGVTSVSVYQWEAGSHCPRPETIHTIALFFNVSIGSLFGSQTDDDSSGDERE